MTISIYQSSTLEKRTRQFFIKSTKVHKGRWDLSKVVYIRSGDNVIFGCDIHGDYTQTPDNHLAGKGCPECGTIIQAEKKRSKAANEFESKANEVHKGRWDLSKVVYICTNENVIFGCSIHGEFPQTPANHLSGNGCPDCAIIYRAEKKRSKAAKEFESKSNIVHNNFYIYSLVNYEDAKLSVDIKCPDHGVFPQTPANHLSGNGCPRCSSKGYSKIAIKWLNSINPNIQHAENGGEFKIPDSRYRVDGYDKETNTVYEFHGDDWHGNPTKHKSDFKCHPFNKNLTAGELYQKTIERENEIKSLGYNLIVMWEKDYHSNQRLLEHSRD